MISQTECLFLLVLDPFAAVLAESCIARDRYAAIRARGPDPSDKIPSAVPAEFSILRDHTVAKPAMAPAFDNPHSCFVERGKMDRHIVADPIGPAPDDPGAFPSAEHLDCNLCNAPDYDAHDESAKENEHKDDKYITRICRHVLTVTLSKLYRMRSILRMKQ